MRSWLLMLGALLAWTVHLFGMYAIASAIDLFPGSEGVGRAGAVALSVACLAAVGVLLIVARRHRDEARFHTQLTVWSAVVALAAITFQTLPFLLR